MILQEDVGLWIQITGGNGTRGNNTVGPDRLCEIFPITQYNGSIQVCTDDTVITVSPVDHLWAVVVEDTSTESQPYIQLTRLGFTLTQTQYESVQTLINLHQSSDVHAAAGATTAATALGLPDIARVDIQRVQYLWYNNWDDFSTPPVSDNEVCYCMCIYVNMC